MFDAESQIVKTWVRLVKEGAYTKDHVPKLLNLRDVVNQILEAENESA